MPAKAVTTPDWYEILQVHPRACPEVIEAARRVLIRKAGLNHDGLLDQAFDVVFDPVQRADYDRVRMEDPGKGIIGDYRIMEFIAEGGFGRTYRGEHIMTGLPVCIKDCSNVPPEYHSLLIEEARAMWDLRHHAIPAVRDIVKGPNGDIALVMSYIPGHTLAKYVERHGRLDAEHVAWIAERMLHALKYIHFNGVIHGDIKPHNVIIQPESHLAVLVDFGLATVRPNRTSGPKGYTQNFAPPESMHGGTPIPELGNLSCWSE